MPRVKRSVHARKKRRKVLGEAKGYWGLKNSNYKYAKEQVERSLAYAYRDRKVRKREFRKLWIMRINAGARANGLSYNQFMHGLKAAERRARPEGARRSRGRRSGEVRRDRRAGQVGARRRCEITRQAEIFNRQAAYCDGRSPLYAELCRRLADDPRVGDIAPDLAWDLPLRLLARPALPRARRRRLVGRPRRRARRPARRSSRGGRPSRTCRRTRCSARGASCPAFLSSPTGGRSTCSSSGPSAGLNLLWDRYRYRYSTRYVGERPVRARR